MKKIMFIICLILAFPIMTSAHTTVSTSTPSEGEVITEELREFTLEFAGKIENQGTLTLVHEQEKIEIDPISIEENKIVGSLPSSLENGNYTLTWKVASTDGHVLTGDIPFTVDKPVVDEEVEDEDGQAGKTEEISEQDPKAPTEENTELETDPETEAVKDNSSLISTISIVVLVVLLALGIWILLRKKR